MPAGNGRHFVLDGFPSSSADGQKLPISLGILEKLNPINSIGYMESAAILAGTTVADWWAGHWAPGG
jgi:hypothetical protein